MPFWSPDGRFIAFFADKKLKRVESDGGSPLVLYDVDGLGGSWSKAGDIVFTGPSGAVYRLPAAGGKAEPVTKLDEKRRDRAPLPVLPPGRQTLPLSRLEARRKFPGPGQPHLGGVARRPSRQAARPRQLQSPVRERLPAVRAGRRLRRNPGGAAVRSRTPRDARRRRHRERPDQPVSATTSGSETHRLGDRHPRLRLLPVPPVSSGSIAAGKQIGMFGEPGPRFGARISPDGPKSRSPVGSGTQTTQSGWAT